MLHICCIRAGEAFSPAYVNILFDSVRRNLADGFEGEFVCFTDQTDTLDSGIIIRPLPADLPGWWSKIALFQSGLFPDGDRVLFLDLDTVITGRLDEIVAYEGGFATLRDFYRPDGLQSSVMAWEAGTNCHIWEMYKAAGCPMDIVGGDQIWLEQTVSNPSILQDEFTDLFVSFKKIAAIPRKASVVVFHGNPRPHEVTEGWVPEVWKIGGMTRAELDTVCNTQMADIVANVRSSTQREIAWLDTAPAHTGHAVLVGGGPSLGEQLEELKWRKDEGQSIWALNGSARWLRANGIEPDYHVLVDARSENIVFVSDASERTRYLIASQCCSGIFDALTGHSVTLWHPNLEAIADLLRDETTRPVHMIGGGSTVGLNAMVLAFAMGYRQIHLYGFDSSYRSTGHHAYAQAINDGHIVVDAICAGQKFKTTPWMVQQAEEFAPLARDLTNDGCIITVSGDGLLPTLARDMMHDQGSSALAG